MTDRDATAIASRDREDDTYIRRATGPRRTAPGICPVCGEPVPERPFFGDATCGKAECREMEVRR